MTRTRWWRVSGLGRRNDRSRHLYEPAGMGLGDSRSVGRAPSCLGYGDVSNMRERLAIGLMRKLDKVDCFILGMIVGVWTMVGLVGTLDLAGFMG